MVTNLLELLKDANLIKFFSIVGSIFFLIGIIGRVWGIKEPVTGFPRFIIGLAGILMLVGAATGFIDNKNQSFSAKANSPDQATLEQLYQSNNEQKVGGKNNKTIGNTIGNNNQNVQGNNNKLNNNSPINKSSYKEGDYIVYYTYNTITGDTTITKRIRIKTNIKEDNEEDSITCPLNNRTYYMITMRPHYFIKFYDRDGNTYKFIAYINAYDYHGIAIQKGESIVFTSTDFSNDKNSEIGQASLSNSCKYLTGHLGGHSLNFTL